VRPLQRQVERRAVAERDQGEFHVAGVAEHRRRKTVDTRDEVTGAREAETARVDQCVPDVGGRGGRQLEVPVLQLARTSARAPASAGEKAPPVAERVSGSTEPTRGSRPPVFAPSQRTIVAP
jgi:hypothetical protein